MLFVPLSLAAPTTADSRLSLSVQTEFKNKNGNLVIVRICRFLMLCLSDIFPRGVSLGVFCLFSCHIDRCDRLQRSRSRDLAVSMTTRQRQTF